MTEEPKAATFKHYLFLCLFLYVFIFSLELMGVSLRMFSKGFAVSLIRATTNPFVGLFIGIITTSVIQSSSSTTSIVVGMVAGGAVDVISAIPIVMGANIGTSVTNTLVSLPEINRTPEFQRAFSASVVHDFFNILTVLVLFPIQLTTNFLGKAATLLEETFAGVGGLSLLNPVKRLTRPIIDMLVHTVGMHPLLLFLLSLGLLLLSLKLMVGALKALVVRKEGFWFETYLMKTPLHAFLVGCLLTAVVQSSSITTSLLVPLAAAGALSLEKIFPCTLGANIGTTVTATLAALVTGSPAAVIVAFSHMIFNVLGIIVWWPLQAVPLFLAKRFAKLAANHKVLPFVYVLTVFFLVPFLCIWLRH